MENPERNGAPLVGPTPAPSVLVVEDELFVRMVISDSLRDAGFNVIEAYNADEALVILQSGVIINLMLSDVRMPGSMDGLALLEYVRDSFPALPVIITSGHLVPDKALLKGAVHFLGKPYLSDHAVALVKQELDKAR